MSAEMYAAIEYRNRQGWLAREYREASFAVPIDQDYDLFAILANVRNGSRYEGDLFEPIACARGFPADISDEARQACTGDHSPTWVGLREILDFDWTRSVTKYGYLNGVEYARWDRNVRRAPWPARYHGEEEIARLGVAVITEADMQARLRPTPRDPPTDLAAVYCKASWKEGYALCAEQLWQVLLPPMLLLSRQYGLDNVRLVANFMS